MELQPFVFEEGGLGERGKSIVRGIGAEVAAGDMEDVDLSTEGAFHQLLRQFEQDMNLVGTRCNVRRCRQKHDQVRGVVPGVPAFERRLGHDRAPVDQRGDQFRRRRKHAAQDRRERGDLFVVAADHPDGFSVEPPRRPRGRLAPAGLQVDHRGRFVAVVVGRPRFEPAASLRPWRNRQRQPPRLGNVRPVGAAAVQPLPDMCRPGPTCRRALDRDGCGQRLAGGDGLEPAQQFGS